MDGIVDKYYNHIDQNTQDNEHHPSINLTLSSGMIQSNFKQPGITTVKKKAFTNITYSPEQNNQILSWRSLKKSQVPDDSISKFPSSIEPSPINSYIQSSKVSSSHKQKSHNKSKESPKKNNRVDKENSVLQNNHWQDSKDRSLLTLESGTSDTKEKLSSLSPTKFERFV